MLKPVVALFPLLFLVTSGGIAAEKLSEQDYFSELPVVLSVTRLAQPLDDVPGAVTVIDREMIRRSGAREITDVLRLVPGFLLNRWQGGPVVSYHAGMDIYGSRMQVYVDGRSVYSTYFLGDTHLGLRGLVLEDIERIEVLRGSNSASDGANAFLGVVNVITRHAADTQGVMVSVTQGDGAINDNVVRYGWGDMDASYRLTASRRKDSGLWNRLDDANMARLTFRGDLNVSPRDKVFFSAGMGDMTYLDGSGQPGNQIRPVSITDININGRWQRDLDETRSIQLRVTHDVDHHRDRFIHPISLPFIVNPVVLSQDGKAQRTELGIQYSVALKEGVRVVSGVEYRREAVESKYLFATEDEVSAHQWRIFGNVEWQASPKWLFQAGGLHEAHSALGSTFSPRLAANYHVLPNHTLRAVSTKAYRAPSVFEQRGDRQYLNSLTGTIVPFVGRGFLAVDDLSHESIRSDELGYLGQFHQIGLTVGVRSYIEKIDKRIEWKQRNIPPFANVLYATNTAGPTLRGLEYELTWEPRSGTRVLYNESHIRHQPVTTGISQESPYRTSMLAWFQDLPGGLEGSLISSFSTPVEWASSEAIGTSRRLDLRLGMPFRIGATKGDVALTTQSINGGHFIFRKDVKLDRRAFITLRLDY
jgi:iron complex outermembrane receptor protein